MRRSRRDLYRAVACEIAGRSTCPRGKYGAVIVSDRGVLVFGYPGAPKGMPHCTDVGCEMVTVFGPGGCRHDHCVRTIHAEMNAIIAAARKGVPTEGATLYVNSLPCKPCAMAIINAGIKEVDCYNNNFHDNGLEILRDRHVGVTLW